MSAGVGRFILDASSLETLLVVALVAAIAPMLVSALPAAWRVPQVVILIFSGILIGPHGLGLSETSSVKLLANIGLGFLFLLAGYELDLRLLGAHEGRLAMIGWVVSAVVVSASAIGMKSRTNPALVSPATALGTLLPILSENEMLGGQFGRYVLATGAVGELFPIVAISLFLTKRDEFVAIGSLAHQVRMALTEQR